MSIVREFDNGCVLYGSRELPPQQLPDSNELDNQHDTIDDHGGESVITPADTWSAFQDEHDQQQPLEEEEERIQTKIMIDISSSDIQPGKKELEGDGEQSEKQQEESEGDADEGDGDQSEKKKEESEGDGDQSDEKQKQKCSESIATTSTLVEGESSSQVQRLVLSPGSESQGVTQNKITKHWEAHIWIKEIVLRERKKKGVQIFAGNYRTEDDAKQAHDRLAIKFDIRENMKGKPYPLNFPESAQADFMAEHGDWTTRDFVWKIRRSSGKFSWGKSDMKGVTVRTSARKKLKSGEEESGPANRYAAKISQGKGPNKRTANLGTHGSEEDAGKAYDRALLFINKDKEEVEQWHVITNFRPSNYTTDEVLEAGSKLVFKQRRATEMHEMSD